jgi:putative transposase
MRKVLVHAPTGLRRMVSALIATIFAQETEEAAHNQWRTVMGFPKEHRSKIYSTNPLERLNGEIERRTDVVGIFPNEPAIYRLVGAHLLEQNGEWASQRRYMTLETLAEVGDNPSISLSAVTI